SPFSAQAAADSPEAASKEPCAGPPSLRRPAPLECMDRTTRFHRESDVSAVRDILILGSGAAGYTAGIYAARSERRPLLLGGIQSGGQLTITTDVENYPGFGHGIQGPDLMEAMKQQAVNQGVEIIEFASAEKVDFSRRPFHVWSDEGTLYQARAVIVATGA